MVYKDPHLVRSVKERLISDIEKGIVYFSFGKQTEFSEMCYDLLSALQKKFPHIVREKYFSENDDDFRVYEKSIKIPRCNKFDLNKMLIDNSDICYVYFYDYLLKSQIKCLKKDELEKYEKDVTTLSCNYANNHAKHIFLIKK